jgi:hypothetical protein
MVLQDHFCQTPTEAAGGAVPAPLRGRPGDTPVMMYCTGGIRCDIYSTYLRQKARPLPHASYFCPCTRPIDAVQPKGTVCSATDIADLVGSACCNVGNWWCGNGALLRDRASITCTP